MTGLAVDSQGKVDPYFNYSYHNNLTHVYFLIRSLKALFLEKSKGIILGP